MTAIDPAEARVLTIRQPWASAIAVGPKRVENRTRWTSYRGPLAIHAGLTPDPVTWLDAPEVLRAWSSVRPNPESALPRGVVLATARLASVHWHLAPTCHCDGWAQQHGRIWHWVLDDVQPLEEPIPHRGGLGLRRAPELWAQLTQGVAS